jgi:predicted phage terminase large subunit-like protein
VLRGRFDYPALKTLAISHANVHRPNTILIAEAGVGNALVKETQNAGLSAIAIKPEQDKRTRMSIESGKLFPPWLSDLENELFVFPTWRYDDQVDSISQALAREFRPEDQGPIVEPFANDVGAQSVGSGLECSDVVNRQKGIVILREADLRTIELLLDEVVAVKVIVVWKGKKVATRELHRGYRRSRV